MAYLSSKRIELEIARTRQWHRALVLLGSILSAGCTLPSVQGLPKDESTWTPNLAPYSVAFERTGGTLRGAIPESARTQINALILETRRVIVSNQFRKHLARYSDGDLIKISPTGRFEDGRTLLASYLGVLRTPSPISVVVSDDAPPNEAVPGTTGISSDKTHAEMHLTSRTLERWNDGISTRRRSCAINTVAHELTHTVVDNERNGVYKDRGYSLMWLFGGGDHVVSYTVGTVAQCTWLEERGEDYNVCIGQMGTKEFSGYGCD